ncbi:MAG TPA: bifunctional riboflavin kinase/FAD synthetase [Firmicutes bacterium]|nr:bifunctional riboflavin kinase/FAD synthetase [Bacillota bacterium]
MEVVYSREAARDALAGRASAVALGMFDGIHLGHKSVLQRLMSISRRQSLLAVVMTFDRHPVSVLTGENVPSIISPQEKIRLIGEFGVDLLIFWPFDMVLANKSCEEFGKEILKETLNARAVVVGYNYTFGAGGRGTPSDLSNMGASLGFKTYVVPPTLVDGRPVASTEIRNLLASGRVREAISFLGRPFSISGRVIAGHGRGRALGFPTANLVIPPGMVQPANGVYTVEVRVGGRMLPGVTNVGFRPTFGEENKTVEVHILDSDLDLYGKEITVYFIEKIRDETKFHSPGELARQIASDVMTARNILAVTRRIWYNGRGLETSC